MIEGREGQALGGPPTEDDPIAIDRRRRRGDAVEFVMFVFCGGEFAFPGDGAVGRIEADRGARVGGFIAAEEEDPVAPDDGRSVSDAWQFGFPGVVGVGPFGGDVGIGYAAAVRSAETRPFLAMADGGAEQGGGEQGGGEQGKAKGGLAHDAFRVRHAAVG